MELSQGTYAKLLFLFTVLLAGIYCVKNIATLFSEEILILQILILI